MLYPSISPFESLQRRFHLTLMGIVLLFTVLLSTQSHSLPFNILTASPVTGTLESQPIDAALYKTSPAVSDVAPEQIQAKAILENAPPIFVENVGQFDSDARFRVSDANQTLWLAEDAIWLTVLEPASTDSEIQPIPRNGANIKLSFVGANPQRQIEAYNQLDTTVSNLIGNNPETWHADIPAWGGVRYRELYSGLDLDVTIENGQLLLRLIADDSMEEVEHEQIQSLLRNVRLQVDGVDRLYVTESEIHLATPYGTYRLPLVQIDGIPNPPAISPAVADHTIIAPFNSSVSPLLSTVALPVNTTNLIYSTFVGGSGQDVPGSLGKAARIDADGNIYSLVRANNSTDFPTTPGAFDPTYNGHFSDLAVFKLSADGTQLLYATYLGGNGWDSGWNLFVDDDGNAYVTGGTNSTNFPTTDDAYDNSFNGGGDAFVVKLNASGSGLIYGTYIGGSAINADQGAAITVNDLGEAYIAGVAGSSDFPTTPGAYDTSFNGGADPTSEGYDAFVAKLDASGSDLLLSTLMGGSRFEHFHEIEVDSTGAIYVSGITHSSNFPVLNAFQGSSGGGRDAVIVKFNPTASDLVYSTYLGGAQRDDSSYIAVDSAGYVYVAGSTQSTDFPVVHAYQGTHGGGTHDGFLAKLDVSGNSLIFSTYFGTSGVDTFQGIRLDGDGNILLSGSTSSSDFPTTPGAYDTSFNGASDATFLKFSNDGSVLEYSTLLGGSALDWATTNILDDAGNIVLVGYTESLDFPVTPSAFDTSYNGNGDAFIVRLGFAPTPDAGGPYMVTATSPPNGAHDISSSAIISATLDQDVDLSTVGSPSFAVHGSQSGRLAGTYGVSSENIHFDSNEEFKPGEEIRVSLTEDIQSVGGADLSPYVWKFTGEVDGGHAYFVDSGQSLGQLRGYSVELGDVDGDGDLDAYVANIGEFASGGQPNQVWLNDGAGVFADSGQNLGNNGSNKVSLGDLDGDGDLDAFVANFGRPAQSDRVWFNEGGVQGGTPGVFVDSGQSLGPTDSNSVDLGDVDGDGDLDAFVTNYYSQPNKVWLNDGAGMFSDSGQSLGNLYSYDVELADLDGDGDLDAFVANEYAAQPNQVWLNDGTGTFTDSGQSLGNSNTEGLALGDLDGDGDLDAFVANIYNQPNEVWLNDGSGTFIDSDQTLGGAYSREVGLGDLDGDGDLDALVVNGGRNGSNTIWLNDGTGVFSNNGQSLVDSQSHQVGLGDLDGDGDLDAFVANDKEGNKVWLNEPPPPIKVLAVSPPNAVHDVVSSAAVSATLDQDVDPSTVDTGSFMVHGSQTGSLTGTYGVSSGNIQFDAVQDFKPGEEIAVTLSDRIQSASGVPLTPFAWQFRTAAPTGYGYFVNSGQALAGPVSADVSMGDLDGDGDLDAFVPSFLLGQPGDKVWLNNGGIQGGTPGTFTDNGQSLGNQISLSVDLGDVDGDGDLDALVGTTQPFPNKIWLNDGSGFFTDSGQNLGTAQSYGLALGDLDGDGDLDAFICNGNPGQPNKVWLNNGSGAFTNNGQSLGNLYSLGVDLGDLDNDGDLDAFVGNGLGQPSKVWLNDGSGLFTDSGQNLGISFTFGLALGDLDGDSDLDAFVTDFGDANKVWVNDGTGFFTDSGQALGNSYSLDVALGDVDSDGDLDGFVANSQRSASDPVDNKLWLNDGLGNFSDSGQRIGDVPTPGVAMGDIDGDGDLDIFAATSGNIGVNEVWFNKIPLSIDAGPDATINEGDTFSGVGSFADEASTWTAAVDYGEGSGAQPLTLNPLQTFNLSHPYADDGAYTATVTITNNFNEIESDMVAVTVRNVAPTAIFSNDGPVNEGSDFTLSLTDPYDPSSVDTTAGFEYDFDCGNGYDGWSTSNSEACPTTDNGSPTVNGKIRDKDGGVNLYTDSVTVNNVAPTATFGNDGLVNEGSDFTLSLTGPYDPSRADTTAGFEYAFNCGGGYGGWSTTSSATCPTDDNAIVTVKGKIRDKDLDEREYTANVTVNNVAPTAIFGNDGPVNEGSDFTLSLTGPYDPSSADTTAGFQYDFDCGSGYDGWSSENSEACPTTDDGSPFVKGKIKDKDGGVSEYTDSVTINNVAPTASFGDDGPVNEGSDFTLSLTSPYDPSSADTVVGFEYDFDCGGGYDGWSISNSETCPTTDQGSPTVKGKIRDKDGGVSEYTGSVTINNVAPAVTASLASQEVQYSDYIVAVTFLGSDVAADTLSASAEWQVNGLGYVNGLPGSLVLQNGGCTVSAGATGCSWILTGTVGMPAGVYDVKVTIADEDDGQTSRESTITVVVEDASIAFNSGNPVSVQVASPGGDSGEFWLTVYVSETESDLPAGRGAPGDISKANVSMSLVPVGPGGTADGECPVVGVTGTGYDTILEVACMFDAVEVNTYAAVVIVDGGYYAGSSEDVLVVYDPTLGFTTGGGWFYWPGTQDRTNFGYSMKYNQRGTKVQGSLLLIRHLPDGTKYRVKSNSLYGLALGESTSAGFGWATFSGKATYLQPPWLEPIGSHEFTVYVEDHNEPGAGYDHFWIEVLDKDGKVVDAMSMTRPGSGNTTTLSGGNIVVPHANNGKK